jgi:hypothetical protein
MVPNLSRRVFLTACGSAPLFAKDSWQDTKPAEWDDKQIQKILSDSPWAKKVSASMSGVGGGGMEGGGGRGGRGRGGGGMGGGMDASSGPNIGGGGGPGGGGGMGPGGGRGFGGGGGEGSEGGGGAGMPSMIVTVRWLSAAPLLLAPARLQKRETTAKPDGYLLGVFGLPGRMAQRGPDSLKQMLKENTRLKVKGREPLEPEQVDLTGSRDQTIAALFKFSNKEPLSLDDKEVEFDSKVGPFELKCKFKTKDMMFDGKLAV